MADTEIESGINLESPTQQNKDNILDNIDEQEIEINDKLRNTFFVILCLVYCISCCDGGIIPQQNLKLIESFDKSGGDSRVGLFSSIDYIGRILGAVLMSFLINKIDRKIYFSGCCFLKGITLFIPLIKKTYTINLIFRLISGIPQTLLTSYGTMWTDQFGKRKHRSMMLAILQFFTLIGAIVGYGIGIIWNAILGSDKTKDLTWRLSFLVEGIGLVVLGFIFLFFPKLYFSSSFYLNQDSDYKGKEKLSEQANKDLLKENNPSFWKQLPQIVCTKLFIFMSISNTVAFFGMRVIQYYADKYMEKVLLLGEKIKQSLYVILCITGPIIGNIVIGIVCTKIGGYASKNGMKLILVLNIVASISSTFITVTLSPILSLFCCWLYLFCFASAVPLQGGLIIASLPKNLKSNGFALNMFFLNLIGSFPSAYVYSLIADSLDKHYNGEERKKYRTAMTITMLYNYVGLILAFMAGIFRFRIEGELDKEKEKEKEKEANDEKGETTELMNV